MARLLGALMAALALSTIRQRVATAIATTLTTWQQASDPYDQFGAGDGDRLHQSFAVGVPSSAVLVANDRQIPARGVSVDTRLGIRWAYNIGALNQIVDYDAGLDAEALVLAAVMTIHQGVDLHLLYASSTRSVDDQGWMFGEITIRAIHALPLV